MTVSSAPERKSRDPKSTRLMPHGDFELSKKNTRGHYVWVHEFVDEAQPTKSFIRDTWGDGKYRLRDETGNRRLFVIDRMACIRTDMQGRELLRAGNPPTKKVEPSGVEELSTLLSQHMKMTEARFAALASPERPAPRRNEFDAVRSQIGQTQNFMKDIATVLAPKDIVPPEASEDATVNVATKLLNLAENYLAKQAKEERQEQSAAKAAPLVPPFLAELSVNERLEVEDLMRQLSMSQSVLATTAAYYGLQGFSVVEMLRGLVLGANPRAAAQTAPAAEPQRRQRAVPTQAPPPEPEPEPGLDGMTPKIERELRELAEVASLDWDETVAAAREMGIDAPTALAMAKKHLEALTSPAGRRG